MFNTREVVIVDALRTPIGNFNGGLSTLDPQGLGAIVIKKLLERTSIDSKDISEVIMGQVLTANCGQNPARQAALLAGLPESVPAWLVNQVCGSGLRSIALGAQAIALGESDIVIAGGQENMSQAPHAAYLRQGIKMGEGTFTDTMIKDGLWEAFHHYHMGVTAENIASKFGITRHEQDVFACASQQKAQKAQQQNIFADEIIPVSVQQKREMVEITRDEFPRSDVTVEGLSKLRPAFKKDGTVTAGNASGINDGAAAVILMSKEEAQQRGLQPMARIVSFAQAGVAPDIMGTGPIPAAQAALKKCDWEVAQLDAVEANEAFAAQAICVNKAMGWAEEKVNINGGAIALGHPIGASGGRILVTLLHHMVRNDLARGLATLCVGGGMGVAICVERL